MIGKFIFLGLVISQAKPDQSIESLTQRNCPSSGHLLLPHEYDNTKFYFCEWGSRKEPPRTCAAGTVFSFRLQSCNWPWNVENETESDNNDHEDGTADHGVEEDSDAGAIEEDSEDNNNNGGDVGDLDDVDADNEENFSNGCPTNFTVHRLLPHKYNCSKFYHCVAGKAISKHCSPGLYFNPDVSVCDWPINVDCKNSGGGDNETTDSKDEDLEDEASNDNENNNDETNSDEDGDEGEDLANGCPANFTIYRLLPNQSDCKKFYYCVFGEAVSKKCPSGLYFNPNGSVCDWPWNVDCENDGTEGEDSVECEDEGDIGVGDDENIGDSEGGDGEGDTEDNEGSDDNGAGGNDEGNENEVDGGNVSDRRVKKKKLEVVAEVIVRLKKRHQLKQIYSRREHKIIRSPPTIAGTE